MKSNEIKSSKSIKYDEIIYKKKDGTLILTSDNTKAILDENGQVEDTVITRIHVPEADY